MREILKPAILVPLVAMFAVQTLTSMADLTVPVLTPDAADDVGVDATLIGAWIAVLYGAAMVSGLATGPAVHRHGAVSVCQGALALSVLGLALFATAHPLAVLASAVCLGTAYGTVNPASSDVLARHSPARWRALIFSIKQSGVTLGGALAGAAMPVLATFWGWQTAVLVLAGVIALVALSLQATRLRLTHSRDDDTILSKTSILTPIRLILSDRRLRMLTVAAVLFSGVQVCLFSFLVIYLADARGLPLTVAGFAYAAFQVGGVVGRLLWGMVAGGAISTRHLLVLLGLSTAGCLIGLSVLASGWPTIAVFALSLVLGACALGWNGLYLSEVARLAPDGRIGEATGGAQFFFFAGAMALPPAFGVLVEVLDGYGIAFAVIAVMLIGASAAVALAKDARPAADAQ